MKDFKQSEDEENIYLTFSKRFSNLKLHQIFSKAKRCEVKILK